LINFETSITEELSTQNSESEIQISVTTSAKTSSQLPAENFYSMTENSLKTSNIPNEIDRNTPIESSLSSVLAAAAPPETSATDSIKPVAYAIKNEASKTTKQSTILNAIKESNQSITKNNGSSLEVEVENILNSNLNSTSILIETSSAISKPENLSLASIISGSSAVSKKESLPSESSLNRIITSSGPLNQLPFCLIYICSIFSVWILVKN